MRSNYTDSNEPDSFIAGSPPGIFIRPFTITSNPCTNIGFDLTITSDNSDDLAYKLLKILESIKLLSSKSGEDLSKPKYLVNMMTGIKQMFAELGKPCTVDFKENDEGCVGVFSSDGQELQHVHIGEYTSKQHGGCLSDVEKIKQEIMHNEVSRRLNELEISKK